LVSGDEQQGLEWATFGSVAFFTRPKFSSFHLLSFLPPNSCQKANT
jgi:hypothetical protein